MMEKKQSKVYNKHKRIKNNIKLMITIGIVLFICTTIMILYKPIIHLKGKSKITMEVGEKYQDQGVVVKTFGKEIKDGIEIENNIDSKKIGTYKVKYQVRYLNGKISKYRTVKVVDNKEPIITLEGSDSVYLEENTKYVEPGYQAIDNYDGDITKNVKVENKVNPKKIGTYQVRYYVSDQSENKSEVTRTVHVVKKQDPNLKTIYLTFDDGPSHITPQILDILKRENVKATFFTIGKDDSYNDILKRIVNEGHTLALHSNTHDYELIYASMDAYFKDLYALRDRLKKITGVSPNIIRFPGGSSNTVSSFNPGIMSHLTIEVMKRGFYYFDWNVGSEDTERIGSDAIVKNVTESLGNYHTYVVLMHDYGLNEQTRDALERIIKYGKSHGYRFDKITPTTPAVHHGINN